MARSQVPNFADNFKAVITTAAWRTKPSWMLVATKDRTINPDLERWYATRAKSHTKEAEGASHAVYVSHPKEVAALIWTLCMAAIGFFMGLKTQGAGIDVRELTISTLWAGLIGFGFGSIYSRGVAASRLVIYWAGTLGLVAAFFGPLLRVGSFPVQESLAALIGILMGVLIGTVQLRAARRVSRVSNLPTGP